MFTFAKIVTLLCVTALAASAEKQWWETASFYQIYPRSFKDSNGDGVGDLRGVTEELAYLKEIGITATWLSPIFTSPMADFGYDIANFTEIDPIFGTMADLEALLVKAKSVGVKIILDFVPNHSSDECDWFQRSVNRDPAYKDFYVWHPGKIVNGVRQPPTNWISVFRGSQWTWNEKRQEYYLHQFVAKQPDFNYRNPAVVETMKDVLRFWLKKGVDGFRVDAVPHVFEAKADANGNFADEPRNTFNNDPLDYGYLQHIYTTDQPETIDLVYQFRKVLDEHKQMYGGEDRILMTEAYSPIDVIMQYYGNATTAGSQIPFNFELITTLNKNSDAHHYAQVINRWLSHVPAGRTSNWVMGNHDQKRLGTRVGEDRLDMINLLLLALPGCSITYMGEEIGMSDVWISWKDTVDPQACQANPEIYENMSRDPCRTPFQWSDQSQAGFTSANTTWLPISDNYKMINVKRERGISMSHLNVYKQMQSLRQENTFRNGDVSVKAVSENVLAVKRALAGDYTYVLVMNVMDNVESLNLNAVFSGLTTDLEYVTVTDRSARRKGDKVYADSILLMPKEAVVLRTSTRV